MKNENKEHCKQIAMDIERIVNGNMYRCPECGEWIAYNSDYYNYDNNVYTCNNCDETSDMGEFEPASLMDYFDDVLDIEYRIGSDKEYRSVRLMVTCGGPNIYVDTGSKKVELYWWTEYADYMLDIDACNAIDELFKELWNC